MRELLLIAAVLITASQATLESAWAWIPVAAAQLSLASSSADARAVYFWVAIAPLIYTAAIGKATWLGIGISLAVGTAYPDAQVSNRRA